MTLPAPAWLKTIPADRRRAERARFFLRLAALYATPAGHMTELAAKIGLHPKSLGAYARPGAAWAIPARVARTIEKATGDTVSRKELSPALDAE